MTDLDYFFRSPRVAPQDRDSFSQLYLLRRDIETCFGFDPNTGLTFKPVDATTHQKIYCKAIWPGTMAILAGIDLLAKFFIGSDKSGGRRQNDQVGWRFESFAQRYLGLSKDDAHLLYHLRNSLLHSFGLYSEEYDKKSCTIKAFNFNLSQGFGVLIEHQYSDFYRIDIDQLRACFDKAISDYESDLRDASIHDHKQLNNNFTKMFPKHARPMQIFIVRKIC